MPTQAAMDEHYHSYYRRKKRPSAANAIAVAIKTVLSVTGWYALRHKTFLSLIGRYARKGVLLDYGCGEGQMLMTARNRGWDVIGVDYSNENAVHLAAQGIDVRCAANLAATGIPDDSLDCIVAKHVIEHVVDIKGFLADCRQRLKPGGVIAIKTPSRTTLRARLSLANWHFVNPPEHQWGFQPHCFRLLMESNGFQVVYLKDSLVVDELFCVARRAMNSSRGEAPDAL
jgi:2-polyprenyl-3-methyl-5-hydroxy-6-metoxy-1,4-benzoquinol methylase